MRGVPLDNSQIRLVMSAYKRAGTPQAHRAKGSGLTSSAQVHHRAAAKRGPEHARYQPRHSSVIDSSFGVRVGLPGYAVKSPREGAALMDGGMR